MRKFSRRSGRATPSTNQPINTTTRISLNTSEAKLVDISAEELKAAKDELGNVVDVEMRLKATGKPLNLINVMIYVMEESFSKLVDLLCVDFMNARGKPCMLPHCVCQFQVFSITKNPSRVDVFIVISNGNVKKVTS